MSMVKGLVVGFLWGGVVAAAMTLVLSLAMSVPQDRLADGAQMPPAQPASPEPQTGGAEVSPDATTDIAALSTPEADAAEPGLLPDAPTAPEEAGAPPLQAAPEVSDETQFEPEAPESARVQTELAPVDDPANPAALTNVPPDTATTPTPPEPQAAPPALGPEPSGAITPPEIAGLAQPTDAPSESPVPSVPQHVPDRLPIQDQIASLGVAGAGAPPETTDAETAAFPDLPEVSSLTPPAPAPSADQLPTLEARSVDQSQAFQPAGLSAAPSGQGALPAGAASDPPPEMARVAVPQSTELAVPSTEAGVSLRSLAGDPVLPRPPHVASAAPLQDPAPTASVAAPGALIYPAFEDPMLQIADLPRPHAADAVQALPDTQDPVLGLQPPAAMAVLAQAAGPTVLETVQPPPGAASVEGDAARTTEVETTSQPETDAETDAADATAVPVGEGPAPQVRSPLAGTVTGPQGLGLPQVSRFGIAQDPENPEDIDATAAPDPSLPDTGEPGETLPALLRFAAEFDEAETRPLLAIILVAGPDSPVDPATLAELPIPVSVALAPEAAEMAQDIRDAGLEIVLQLGDTSGSDEALAAALAALPETVALLDGTQAQLQSDRTALDRVIGQMRQSGHGLVAYPRGFNTAARTAAREGLSAITLFRDLDGLPMPEMRRVLERAGFAAGLEDGLVLVAPLEPDVIGTLVSWALGDRPDTVAIAPVSAVLLQR